MSLTDQELFDIIEPRHPCSGTTTLSLEDVQLRVQQKMQDLKLDEKMVASKEAISRTWMSGSLKVRGAVGSAWANLDQYRSTKKDGRASPTTETDRKEVEKKDSFVGGWTAWATEKRKKTFLKEEPVRPSVDIGPAPARPLAQWAKRSSDASSTLTSPQIESVRSSVDKNEAHQDAGGVESKDGMEEVKL
jgi:hypothetical protein